MVRRLVVIYTRFSSTLQSPKSCVDQEREVRAGLDKLGVDHSDAVVIRDEAESGTNAFRVGFRKIEAMARSGEISILAVDDQSRLTRGANALAFLQDLVYSGGRFISLGDNIDTNQENWAVMVQVIGIHNSTTINELGRRVKRGQTGRLLNGLTAGDYPLGYEPYFVNPDAALQARRGPKPEKNIRVDEAMAQWIRQVFTWFNEGYSIQEIARRLSKNKVARGSRSKGDLWDHHQVRRLLSNEKYIGIWVWGKTKNSRSSSGRVKQIDVPKEDWVRVVRDDLRIIDQQVWEKTQLRLEELRLRTRSLPGKKNQSQLSQYSALYRPGLLNGLLYCECGTRMWQCSRVDLHNFACPQARKSRSHCTMTSLVPTKKAIDAVLGAVVTMLQSQKDWRQQIVDSIGHRVEELSKTVPQELEILRKQELELNSQIDNLVQFIASGSIKRDSVATRLVTLEAQRSEVQIRMSSQESLVDGRITVPTESFIDEELSRMVSLLNGDSPQAANLLRRIVPKVTATHIVAVGKKRGYTQIRFRLDGWGAMRVAAEADPMLLKFVVSLCPSSDLEPTHPDEIVVDLGQPTEVDKQTPSIFEMRNRGATWKEIEAATGISLNNACTYYKRYKKGLERLAKQSSSDSDTVADVEVPNAVNRPPSAGSNSAA